MNRITIKPEDLCEVKGEALMDSRLLAGHLGTTHKHTIAQLEKYSEQLGKVRFKKAPSTDSRTGQTMKFALLSEDQTMLLVALSRNSPRIVELKFKLIQAFSAARRNAQQRKDEYLPEYHHLHDRIKELASGSDNERFVHMNMNKLINKVAGIEAGQRHTIPVAMLTAVNHVAALAMAGATDCHQGYARAKAALGTLQGLLAPGVTHGT